MKAIQKLYSKSGLQIMKKINGLLTLAKKYWARTSSFLLLTDERDRFTDFQTQRACVEQVGKILLLLLKNAETKR